MKPPVKLVIGIGSLITVAGLAIAIYLFFWEHANLSKAKPDFTISSIELSKEFETDEAVATRKYINKVIEVSGIVGSVKTGEENTLSISLRTGSDFSMVICTFNPGTDLKAISSGDRVTIRGECSGFLLDVLLNYCVIVE